MKKTIFNITITLPTFPKLVLSTLVLSMLVLSMLIVTACSTTDAVRKRADYYYQNENYQKATIKYNELLKLDGDSFDTYYSLGECALKMQDFKAACEYFEKSKEINPSFPDTYLKLARCYSGVGDQEKEQASFEELIKLDPKNVVANAALASFYFDQGKYKQAETCYRAYLEQKPECSMTRSALGATLIALTHYQSAISELDLALKYDAKCVLCHFNLGVAYLGANELDNAERAFVVVTALEPAHQDGWIYLASTFCRQGQNLKAIETLSKAKEKGFSDWTRIEGDTDFTAIINDERYLALK